MEEITFFNSSKTMGSLRNSSQACQEPEESWVPFYIFLSPVFLTGLVGNGLILFVFIRHKNIRSAPNTLLFNLALTDFITLVFCLSAPVYDLVGQLMPALCPVIRLLFETTMHGTGFSLLCLSAERYFAIARPFQTRAASAKFIRMAVILIWVSGVLCGLIKFSLQSPSECEKCVRMINPRYLSAKYAIAGFVIFYIGPLIIIAIFYILMAHKLYLSGQSLPEQNETILRQMNARKRIALLVLLLVIIFAISFFPYHFFSLKLFLLQEPEQVRQLAPLMAVFYCIGCIHISLNPFILYFLSQTFRVHFKNYLFCCIFKNTDPKNDCNKNRQTRNIS